jgi:hypothetical protein
MTVTRILVFSCASFLAVSTSAFSQRWGHADTPRDGACFYKDINFGGEYFCLESGRVLSDLPPDMNDKISSIRIFGHCVVVVYKDHEFKGNSARFENDMSNLRANGWSGIISSVQVRPIQSSAQVDAAIRRAYQDILGREPDRDGMRVNRAHMIDDGWSEAQVREGLKESTEYRAKNMMTVPKAQEMVRQAYLNVLKREPDPGASTYVNKVMREHWTQADVERELRKSPEYKKKDL